MTKEQAKKEMRGKLQRSLAVGTTLYFQRSQQTLGQVDMKMIYSQRMEQCHRIVTLKKQIYESGTETTNRRR